MSRYSSAILDALPLAGAEWEAMQVTAAAVAGRDLAEPWALIGLMVCSCRSDAPDPYPSGGPAREVVLWRER